MSELLDLSSAGILPSPPPSTCQLPYHCCSVRRGLSPCRASRQPCSPLPVAACHLRTPHPITSSLCLSLYLPFHSHFLAVFFKASQKERADDLHELACDSHTHTLNSSSLHPLLSISSLSLYGVSLLICFIWSRVQCHPHFEVTECDATNPAGKLRLIAGLMPLLTMLSDMQEPDRGGALLRNIQHIIS